MDSPGWEPPLAGTELEHLTGALDRLRTTFRWKAGDLDAAGLQARIGASSLTLGGLLKHLALVEDYTFMSKLRGESPGEPWETIYRDDVPDWPFVSAADDTPEQLYALWDGAVARSRARLAAALADGGLDLPADVAGPDGRQPACAGWSSTWSRSTAGTPGTPTCSARRWTGGSARTRRTTGSRRSPKPPG